MSKDWFYFSERIEDKSGLHMRPCDAITNIARIDRGKVYFEVDRSSIDATDIFPLMSAGIQYRTLLEIKMQVTPYCLCCSILLKQALRDPELTEHFKKYIKESQRILQRT